MMRRLRPTLILVALILSSLPSRADTILRAATSFTDKHPISQALYTFKSEVEKTTGGRVKISIVSTKIQLTGDIDIAVRRLSDWRFVAPFAELFDLPFLFDARASQRKATKADGPIRPAIDKQITKAGVHVLWWQSAGTAVIVSTKPSLAYPTSMKDRKVGVFSTREIDWTKGIGTRPLFLGTTRSLSALKNGDIDAATLPIPALAASAQLPNPLVVVLTRHVSNEHVVSIRSKSLLELSEQDRATIAAIAQKIDGKMRSQTISGERRLLEQMPQSATIIDLDPEGRAEWHAATKPTIDAFIKKFGKAGQELVKAARSLN